MEFDDYELDPLAARTASVLTLAEAKLWLKVSQALTDAEVADLQRECLEAGEKHTQRTWLTGTFTLRLPGWPSDGEIVIPRPPLVSVEAVKYYDVDGVERTLSAALYRVTASRTAGRVTLKSTSEWPDLEDDARPFPVSVEFTAGYGATGAALPGPFVSGYRLLLTHLFQNRSQEETGTNVAPRVYGLDDLWALDRIVPL